MARPLVVGAVMYDPKVSVIWEIIRDFFDSQSCPIDVAFYSTYGHVHRMALAVAEGAESVPDTTVRLRRIAELEDACLLCPHVGVLG